MTINIEQQLRQACAEAVKALYGAEIDPATLGLERTNKDHEGDYTVVVFPLLRVSKKKPEETAQDLGSYLQDNVKHVAKFNVIKGFLNLSLSDGFWVDMLALGLENNDYGKGMPTHQKITVEYCGPNTNKPLHLGHIRNMLLGYSVASILEFAGNEVVKVNMYNDRGIAICKSMLAWQKFGNGETPTSSGIKGDHLVGKYYVVFDKAYKAEIEQLKTEGVPAEEAEKKAPLLLEAQEMLRKWEAGDADTLALWKQMNDWVYEGFNQTFKLMGVDFHRDYYESETYLLGRDLVLQGLKDDIFYQKEDGSIWVDLTDKGLDHKVLLRSDGTSVYLTQDLGTADLRYEHYHMDRSVYVVADEQNYHFKVLQLTLEKLGKPYAPGIYHLSYGLVELPHGRMKSREGTVVDADDLIKEMVATAKAQTIELGKLEDTQSPEAEDLYRTIGMGALKYFMLRVDPKKKMLFNPEESIDLQGQTGPFVQYTYARIQSIKTKVGAIKVALPEDYQLSAQEKEVIAELYQYPNVIQESARNFDPSVVASYAYNLAKTFNKFYVDHSIANAETPEAKHLRLGLAQLTSKVLQSAFKLLGIQVPERM